MKEYLTIQRKDGVIYKRKKRDVSLPFRMNLRLPNSFKSILTEEAKSKGINLSELSREIFSDHIKNILEKNKCNQRER